MRIGILGTGTLARALADVWAQSGHDVMLGGRSPEKAAALAASLGARVSGGDLLQAAKGRDAVLLAVPWDAVADVLATVGASLAGQVLIDPVNPVRYSDGTMLVGDGHSAAQEIARLAPGAHVVKAFTFFPASQWHPGEGHVTVAMCGDKDQTMDVVGTLVRDAGGVPANLGPLSRARQLEEAAGLVFALVAGGFDPRSAVPSVPQVSRGA
ncbi:NAD(P)-binding domain-containing protein [Kineosporia sp. NBRC 101677]|uniref:NADPH-dependent F420 reductase n=1 Tax=Kineosporia sp. NBRC 101677 TaxID=3032197 RepID=UPI002553D572|nr:NAD(P)-binding domain-containing protein [Kineosporia sp. NBRC 101677]